MRPTNTSFHFLIPHVHTYFTFGCDHGIEENFVKYMSFKSWANKLHKFWPLKKTNLFKALRKGYRGCRSGSSSLSSSGEMPWHHKEKQLLSFFSNPYP